MGSKLTIVIPTYRNLSQLELMLRSLLLYAPYDYRVIVSNNAIEDALSIQALIKRLPSDRVEAVHNKENLYDGLPITQALSMVDSPYLAGLHDDVRFIPCCPDFWDRLVDLASDERVGCAGPSSNWASELQDVGRSESPDIVRVNFIHGVCQVFRTDVYKEIGGHNRDLGLRGGATDVAICIELGLRGYACVVDRKAYTHHIGNQSSKRKFDKTSDHERFMIECLENSTMEMVDLFGVKAFYEHLKESYEFGSMVACFGEIPWEAERQFSRKISPWI